MEGYIKLHRSMLEWEWFSDKNTCVVFLYCLLKANWKDGRFKGVEVPRGTFITSYATMSKDLKITKQSLVTALKHLESTGELIRKSTNRWQAITVVNYGVYQDEQPQANTQANTQLIRNQYATNKQLIPIEEIKEGNKEIIFNTKAEKKMQEIREKIGAMYGLPK